MILTTQDLEPFIGGELEIQQSNGQLLRGKVKSVTVEDETIKVRFGWLARNDGSIERLSNGWTAETNLDYEVSLRTYTISDAGQGRIEIHSVINGESAIFFPNGYTNADGERRELDRAQVKDLSATSGSDVLIEETGTPDYACSTILPAQGLVFFMSAVAFYMNQATGYLVGGVQVSTEARQALEAAAISFRCLDEVCTRRGIDMLEMASKSKKDNDYDELEASGQREFAFSYDPHHHDDGVMDRSTPAKCDCL